MNRPAVRDLGIFVLLVSLGVWARVAFQHVPNFAPVAAMALFAGYVFAHRSLAVCVPLAVMLISDQLVEAGGYDWRLMLTVYGLLSLPVAFSGPLSRWLPRERFTSADTAPSQAATGVAGLLGCSLLCSLLFFFGTNGMVWATSSWYEPTLAGLLTCYANALPFFRFTLAGDAIFGFGLFSCYALALALQPRLARSAA